MARATPSGGARTAWSPRSRPGTTRSTFRSARLRPRCFTAMPLSGSPRRRRAPSRAGLIECLAKAGWPEGLVQLVEGGEREGMAIMADAAVGAVTLTGGSLGRLRRAGNLRPPPHRPSGRARRQQRGHRLARRRSRRRRAQARRRRFRDGRPALHRQSPRDRACEACARILAHADRGDRGAQLG